MISIRRAEFKAAGSPLVAAGGGKVHASFAVAGRATVEARRDRKN
jgi:hypothetical protein